MDTGRLTSMTSTSLRVCSMICCTVASAPCITSVSCDTPGSWVMATVSESILQLRAANRPATRTRAPASFCNRMERVCFMVASEHIRCGGVHGLAVACGDKVASDHLRVAGARADHRIHASVRVDQNFQEGRPGESDEVGNHAGHILGAFKPPGPLKAIGLRGFDEGLAVKAFVRRGEAALEEKLLPLTPHAIAKIVQHDDLDRQPIRGHGFQLTEIHADAGVAVDIDHDAVASSELRADSGGEAKAHRAHRAGTEPVARLTKVEVLRRPHLVLADAGTDDGAALGMAIDLFDHGIRLHERALPVIAQGMGGLEFGDMGVPRRIAGGAVTMQPVLFTVVAKAIERVAQVADMSPVDGLDLADLGGI